MRAAAEELGVTHGALSRHVRQLEKLLGVALFERHHNRLTLTSAGSRLLAAVTDGFDRITEGALLVDPAQMAGSLQVAATPSIVTNWLLAIIGEFSERYPEIEVRLRRIEPRQTDLSPEFDVALCYGHPGGRRFVVDELFREQFFPVGSPLLIESIKNLRRPADLLNYTLLHDHLQNWPNWLRAAAGISDPAPRSMYLHDAFQAINAARRGYGIALADRMEVYEDLKKGTLIQLSESTIPASSSIYIVRHPDESANMKARLFTDSVLEVVSQVRKYG